MLPVSHIEMWEENFIEILNAISVFFQEVGEKKVFSPQEIGLHLKNLIFLGKKG